MVSQNPDEKAPLKSIGYPEGIRRKCGPCQEKKSEKVHVKKPTSMGNKNPEFSSTVHPYTGFDKAMYPVSTVVYQSHRLPTLSFRDKVSIPLDGCRGLIQAVNPRVLVKILGHKKVDDWCWHSFLTAPSR